MSSRGKPVLENSSTQPTKSQFLHVCLDNTDISNDNADYDSTPDAIFSDVDLRSNELQEEDTVELPEMRRTERSNDSLDDQQSSGGSDTILPEILDDDMIVENESPRGGKYNLRPDPTPTSLKNTDTSKTCKLQH